MPPPSAIRRALPRRTDRRPLPAPGGFVACLACLACLGQPADVHGETPALAIDALVPPVVTTAAPTVVRVAAGRFTDDVRGLIFSHPGIQAVLDADPPLPFDQEPQERFGSFTVRVDPSVPEGVYEAWGVGRYGVSNARAIAVVHEPVELLPPPTATLPELRPGVCYVAALRPREPIAARLAAAEGVPRTVVAAGALDSPAIPALTLADASGTVRVRRRATGAQPAIAGGIAATTAASAGPALLRLHDFLHRGGESFLCAVLIAPRPDHPLAQPSPWKPPAAAALAGLPDWPAAVGERSAASTALRLPPPPWQTVVELLPGRPPALLEFVPGGETAYECEVLAQTLDQPADVRVIVERPSANAAATGRSGWQAVAIGEDGPAAGTAAVRLASTDPLVAFSADPADQPVRLAVADLQLAPSALVPTRATVRVGPPRPRWHAAGHWTPDVNDMAQAPTTGSCLPRGGQAGLHVSLRRAGGFAGAVEIAAETLPAGVSASPAVVAAGQTETELILFAAEDAPAWQGPMRLLARTTEGGDAAVQAVLAATIARGASSERGLPQARLSAQLMLGVVDQDLAPIQIRAGEGAAIEIAQGAAAPVPVRATRRAGGEGRCVLRPQNLPPGATLADVELDTDKSAADPELKIGGQTPPGEYTIWFRAEITVKQSLHPERQARAASYRDRLQKLRDDPAWNGDREALERARTEAAARVEALAAEVAPRDFPTFFSTAGFRLRVVPPAKPAG